MIRLFEKITQSGAQRARRALALMLVFWLVMGMLPMRLSAAESWAYDLEGHASMAAIENLYQHKIMLGDGHGFFRPDDAITRAEFAVLVCRSFGYDNLMLPVPLHYIDLPEDAWYTHAMYTLIALSIIQGYGEDIAAPMDFITRFQAQTIMQRILRNNQYYIIQADETPLTRGDAAMMIHYVVGLIVDDDVDAGGKTFHHATIRKSGASLTNANITGDLFITEGVASGDCWLDTLTIDGRLIVAGGGAHSIHIKDITVGSHVLVDKPAIVCEQPVRFRMIESGDHAVILEGTVREVTVDGDMVILVDADGAMTVFSILKNAADSAYITVSDNAVVGKIIVNIPTMITGSGVVSSVETNISGVVIHDSLNLELENITTSDDVVLVTHESGAGVTTVGAKNTVPTESAAINAPSKPSTMIKSTNDAEYGAEDEEPTIGLSPDPTPKSIPVPISTPTPSPIPTPVFTPEPVPTPTMPSAAPEATSPGTLLKPQLKDFTYNITSRVYTGMPQPVIVTSNIDAFADITVRYNGSVQIPVNAGTYMVSIDVAQSQTHEAASLLLGNYIIEKAKLTAIAEDMLIASETAEPVYIVSIQGFVHGETALTAQSYVSPIAVCSEYEDVVGNYAITVSGGDARNYYFSYVDGMLTVSKTRITMSHFMIDGLHKTYNGMAQSVLVSYAQTVNTDMAGDFDVYYEGKDGTVYQRSMQSPSNAGIYDVTVETHGGTKYHATISAILLGELVIQPKTLNVTLGTLTYAENYLNRNALTPIMTSGGVYAENNATFTISIDGLLNDDNITVFLYPNEYGLDIMRDKSFTNTTNAAVPLTYDGRTNVGTLDAVTVMVGISNNNYKVLGTLGLPVHIVDGQDALRAVPVTSKNILYFNEYVAKNNAASSHERSLHYKLMENITLPKSQDDNNWVSIGVNPYGFSGSFDGQGHTISGLALNVVSSSGTPHDYGMFGDTLVGAVIQNLGLIDVTMNVTNTAISHVGGLVGYNRGVIKNCFIAGDSVVKSMNDPSDLSYNYVGGLVGFNDSASGIVENCYVTADVYGISKNGTDTYVGGIAGYNQNGAVVRNCIALNKSLVSSDTNARLGRITGNDGGIRSHNYAWDGMDIRYACDSDGDHGILLTAQKIAPTATLTSQNGEGLKLSKIYDSAQWTTASYWDDSPTAFAWDFTDVWHWDDANTYMPNQNGVHIAWPEHLLPTIKIHAASSVTYTNGSALTPLKYGDYSEGVATFTMTVDGFMADADANNVKLVITPVAGLIFSGHDIVGHAVDGAKTFTIKVEDDNKVAFLASDQKIVVVDAVGVSGDYIYRDDRTGEDKYVNINILDGQTADHAIPVNKKNIEKFNMYAGSDGSSKHYYLAENIILDAPETPNGSNWTAIGTNGLVFTGSFDGRGYYIKNLTINSTAAINQGMFNQVNNAIIKNLALIDVDIRSTKSFVGGIAAYNLNSVITNCFVTGVIDGENYVGGICGWNAGTVRNCYTTANVSANNTVGGIAGYNNGASANVSYCYATGNISAKTSSGIIGGIVGKNSANSIITNCVALNNVISLNGNALSDIGCIVGNNVGKLAYSHAWYYMVLYSSKISESGSTIAKKEINGTLIGESGWLSWDDWNSVIKWSFGSDWVFGDLGLPILEVFITNNPDIQNHEPPVYVASMSLLSSAVMLSPDVLLDATLNPGNQETKDIDAVEDVLNNSDEHGLDPDEGDDKFIDEHDANGEDNVPETTAGVDDSNEAMFDTNDDQHHETVHEKDPEPEDAFDPKVGDDLTENDDAQNTSTPESDDVSVKNSDMLYMTASDKQNNLMDIIEVIYATEPEEQDDNTQDDKSEISD